MRKKEFKEFVILVQRMIGVPTDGIVGPHTIRRLKEVEKILKDFEYNKKRA